MVSGPAFTMVFTCTGIIISIFADAFNNRRVLILASCLVWWSITTLMTGFVTQFWQLAVLRFGLGIGQAACNPIATSLIADYFDVEIRGSALSIYYWGIYTGYSLSYIIGNAIMERLVFFKNCNFLNLEFSWLTIFYYFRVGDMYIRSAQYQGFSWHCY